MVRVVFRVGLMLALVWTALMESARVVGGLLPQGEEVAFAGYEGVELPHAVNIYRYDLTRRLSVNVTRGARGLHVQPAWSPDGAQIAFISVVAPTHELYVMNADGSDLQKLLRHYGSITYPEWSPDGTKIAYLGLTQGGYRANILNVRSGSIHEFSDTHALDRPLDWSTDGQSIAFTAQGYGSRIVNVETGAADLINAIYPAYSPSATHGDFAYASYTVPERSYNLNITNTQEHTTYSVAFDHNVMSEPVWTQDGSRLAFVVNMPINAPQLFVANRDGTLISDLPTIAGAGYLYPQWTADGSTILYMASYSQKDSLYSVNVDTGAMEQLSPPQVIYEAFAVRPSE